MAALAEIAKMESGISCQNQPTVTTAIREERRRRPHLGLSVPLPVTSNIPASRFLLRVILTAWLPVRSPGSSYTKGATYQT